MIDREYAKSAFSAYTSQYDMDNSKIRHKADHTYRVAENCERIAASLSLNDDCISIAWFLGLLHDIGRFEQVRRYDTFIDAVSVDHAEFGADLLFKEGMIKDFLTERLPEEWMDLLETAIRNHNKLTLPEDLDEQTRCFSDIIRDADKVDIFRVVSEMTFEERAGSGTAMFSDADEASEEVMKYVYLHRCVPRDIRRTRFEGRISHICMAFELVFPESRRLACEQGYLFRLMSEFDDDGRPLWNERARAQMRILRREVEKEWGIL